MSSKLRVLTHLSPQRLSHLIDSVPGIELIEVPERGDPPDDVRAEILLTSARGSPNLPELVKKAGVRWIHTVGTGVERFPFEGVGDRILTCSRGASAIPISEWVLAVMLAFEKHLPDAWIHEPPKRWNMADLGGLHGKTLGVLGMGGIAEAVVRRALPFEMRVIAHRRTPKPSPIGGIELVTLDELVQESDHLVLTAAATHATRYIIGRDTLPKVKRGVHIVNIARGALIDQEALREALDDGRVACASLDVCEPEPLPEGHWLYTHPKVRLSPHTSWAAPGALDRLYDTFIENLPRWSEGKELIGRVDVEEGY